MVPSDMPPSSSVPDARPLPKAQPRPPAAAPEEASSDRLIAELRSHGIAFLTGGRDATLDAEVARDPLATAELLDQLARCEEPSVRYAVIALLLLHPDLADSLPSDSPDVAESARERLIVMALAAIYLQRMWRSRLTLALGPIPWLPARFWRARGLPDPDGPPLGRAAEYGLQALAVRERRRLSKPFNFLSMWQQQVDHLIAQGWRARQRRSRRQAAPPLSLTRRSGISSRHQAGARAVGGAMGMPHVPRGGTPMSMRAPADRERIERFLERLGQQAHTPGRLYLVGGTTMVYEGFRATTVDIDVLVEADDLGPLMAVIRALKDSLDLNIEFVSPGDFIPLPAGWRERSIYIGRYGPLDVFHFDLYSMALSKIERGTERDFHDVVALLGSGRLDAAVLDALFAEVLPRVVTEGMAGMDPAVFEEHYHYLRSLLVPPESHP
ncbi:MAG: hypothetical protein IVW57_02570 [Ktedonobacterales bacterium]|nr:hypothetical protein [Ktedonobacterales bacterium]